MRTAVAALVLLAGCEQRNPGFDSRHRFTLMIVSEAPTEDLCEEARRNAREALYADDAKEYRYWLEHRKEFCALLGPKK